MGEADAAWRPVRCCGGGSPPRRSSRHIPARLSSRSVMTARSDGMLPVRSPNIVAAIRIVSPDHRSVRLPGREDHQRQPEQDRDVVFRRRLRVADQQHDDQDRGDQRRDEAADREHDLLVSDAVRIVRPGADGAGAVRPSRPRCRIAVTNTIAAATKRGSPGVRRACPKNRRRFPARKPKKYPANVSTTSTPAACHRPRRRPSCSTISSGTSTDAGQFGNR